MATTFRDTAIVLKVTPMRDADRRYVVYARNHGKLNLLAVGTRRGKSKMSPHMGWFGLVDIMVARGKRADRLAGASLCRGYGRLLESLPASSLAQGFLLTVDSLTRSEQPEPKIFGLIEEFLEAAADSQSARAADGRGPLFDAAVLRLLDIVGFGPELDRCVHCRAELDDERAAINFLRGGLECPDCRQADSLPVLAETVARLRRFRSGQLLQAAVEPPPHHMTSRIIEALLENYVEDRFPALRFMRRVAG